MENCGQTIKNLDFGFKYIPMPSIKRVIHKFEDKKKEGMWDHLSTVSSEIDDSEDKAVMDKEEASYAVEPHEKDSIPDNVNKVLQSSLFGPSIRKHGQKNRKKSVDDNQSLNQVQQVLSTKLEDLECNESEGKDSLDASLHIVEVVNVAEAGVSEEKTDDNLFKEIGILNEDDGSSVSHHGNEMKKEDSSSMSDKDKNIENEALNTLCNDDDAADILADLELIRERQAKQTLSSDKIGTVLSGIRVPMSRIDEMKTNCQVSKTEGPTERPQTSVGRLEHPQIRYAQPETSDGRPQTSEGRLERPQTRDERPPTRPDTRDQRHERPPTRPDTRNERPPTRPDTRDQRHERPPTRPDTRNERPQTRPDTRDQRDERPPTRPDTRDQRHERPPTRPDTRNERPQTRPDTRNERPPTRPDTRDQRHERPPTRPDTRNERPPTRPDTRDQRHERPPTRPDTRNERPQTRPDPREQRPEHPQIKGEHPYRACLRNQLPHEKASDDLSIWNIDNHVLYRSQFFKKPIGPDLSESRSSLVTLASQAVKQVSLNQERAHKFLSRIYDIIIEPHDDYDNDEFQFRFQRSNQFASLFVRTHLYQIGHMTKNIRTMRIDKPMDVMAKVNSLFDLIFKAARMYCRNIKQFIFNNCPDKLLELTNHILNAIKVCFDRRVCNKKEKAIMDVMKIVNDIRYCIENCNEHGHLTKSFMDILKNEQQQKLEDENLKGKVDDQEVKLEQPEISKESSESLVKDTQDASEVKSACPVKFKCIEEKEYSEMICKTGKKDDYDWRLYSNIRLYPCEKIWSKDSEAKLRGSAGSQKSIQNVKIDKEIPKKSPKTTVRKNVYGYPIKGPFEKPKSPYVVPKEALPKTIKRYPRRSSESIDDEQLLSTINWSEYYKNSFARNAEKHRIFRSQYFRKDTDRDNKQKPGLNSTKSKSNGQIKNTVNKSKLHSTKSTVYDVKKSSSDITSAKQRKIEMLNQQIFNKEDSESDQSSDNGSKKSSKSGTIKKLRFKTDDSSTSSCSRISMKSGENSSKSDKKSSKCDKTSINDKSLITSDKNSLKSDKMSSKSEQNCPKSDKKSSKDMTSKSDKISAKSDKTNPKSDKNHQKLDNNSQKLDKNLSRIDSTTLNEMLKNPQADLNRLMEALQIITMQKLKTMMRSMISHHVPRKDAKPSKVEKMKKSIHHVASDVEPLMKPKSADSQHSMIERLAPNVQFMLVTNAENDDSIENVEEEPTSMATNLVNKKSINSDGSGSSESSQGDESNGTEEIDFSKYTTEELREMAIKEQQMRHEKANKNPLYFNDDDEPKTIFGKISDEILDKLIKGAFNGLLTAHVDENELMKNFIKSELEC